MAAGFQDLLAFLFGWKSASSVVAVSGPYRVAAAEVFSIGAVQGEQFYAGRATGEVFTAGTVAGECNGRSG